MNDIEIIKEKLDTIESLCTDDCINKSTVIEPLKWAIENLIARNKELEEERKQFYNGEIYTANQLKSVEKTTHKYWVHKSKIKEKIEEYDKMIQETYKEITHQADIRRDVCLEIKSQLQELLREGDDI